MSNKILIPYQSSWSVGNHRIAMIRTAPSQNNDKQTLEK